MRLSESLEARGSQGRHKPHRSREWCSSAAPGDHWIVRGRSRRGYTLAAAAYRKQASSATRPHQLPGRAAPPRLGTVDRETFLFFWHQSCRSACGRGAQTAAATQQQQHHPQPHAAGRSSTRAKAARKQGLHTARRGRRRAAPSIPHKHAPRAQHAAHQASPTTHVMVHLYERHMWVCEGKAHVMVVVKRGVFCLLEAHEQRARCLLAAARRHPPPRGGISQPAAAATPTAERLQRGGEPGRRRAPPADSLASCVA